MKREACTWQIYEDRLSPPPFLYLPRVPHFTRFPPPPPFPRFASSSPFVFNQRGSDLRGIKAALNHRDSPTILPLHEDR